LDYPDERDNLFEMAYLSWSTSTISCLLKHLPWFHVIHYLWQQFPPMSCQIWSVIDWLNRWRLLINNELLWLNLVLVCPPLLWSTVYEYDLTKLTFTCYRNKGIRSSASELLTANTDYWHNFP
jgi:hypothetical protein